MTAADSSLSDKKNHWTAASLAGLGLVGIFFVLLAALSWRKWPDVFIDFGTQLYIPWRLNQGAVLYRDLFYFAGSPVSQYFNALLLRFFGTSFSTLIAMNLVLAAALVGFVYRRFLAVSDALTATMIGLGLVIVFIFGNYTVVGNYNYIAPYSHEAVHGVLLSLLAIGWLSDWLAESRLRPAGLAGLSAGLVLLTKPDIFVALAVTAAVALLIHWLGRRELRLTAASLGAFGSAFLLPPLFFLGLFLRSEDWRTSLHSVVFGWGPMFNAAVRNNPFYLRFSGLDNPASHLREMAVHFLGAGLAMGVYAIAFRRLDRWTQTKTCWRWLIWTALVLPLLVWAYRFDWPACGASLPLWCLTAIGFLARRLRQAPRAPKYTFPCLWSVFALILTAKMGLYCRIWHYGFVLAMPAFVAALYCLLWLLPAFLEERFELRPIYLRAAGCLTLLVGYTFLWGLTEHMYSLKRQPIGNGGDKIITFGPGMDLGDGVKIALDWMETNVPANATLAVLPSGITLNYLTRHVNPTPCLFWDPNSLAVFGQKEMTDDFEAAPPDYVLLVGGDHNEYGIDYFGSTPSDGAEVMQWIRKNYRGVLIIGNEPLRDNRFGLEFLKHIPPTKGVTSAVPNH